MNWHVRGLINFALGLAITLTGCGKSALDEGTVVSIIYSSDTRGKLEGCGCKKNGGGITKRAAKLEAAREEDNTVLYLDAGNILSGTSEVDNSKGEIITAVYNQLGATAVNVSERELNFGFDEFQAAKKNSKFDYVSANLRYKGGDVANAYVVKKVKGAKVAIVGLCGTRNVMRYDSLKLTEDVTIEDPVTVARRIIPGLEGSADVIVVLSTCGDEVDSTLAQDLQMIDLIIGGRSYRPNSDTPWVMGNTRIVRTNRDGRTMGRMDLVFGPERQIKTFSPKTINMETSDPSSGEMLALVRKYIPSFVDSPAEGVRITTASENKLE